MTLDFSLTDDEVDALLDFADRLKVCEGLEHGQTLSRCRYRLRAIAEHWRAEFARRPAPWHESEDAVLAETWLDEIADTLDTLAVSGADHSAWLETLTSDYRMTHFRDLRARRGPGPPLKAPRRSCRTSPT